MEAERLEETLDRHVHPRATGVRGETGVVMARCAGTKRDGKACTTGVPVGVRYCYHHDPALARERSAKASHAASAKHDSIAKEIRGVRELIRQLFSWAIVGELNPSVKQYLAELAQLLQVYVRLTELQIATGEKPEQGGLALPADFLDRFQQYVTGEEGQNREARAREDDGRYWEDGEEDESDMILSEPKDLAEELLAMEEMSEELAEGWRRRLQAEIDRELRAQPS